MNVACLQLAEVPAHLSLIHIVICEGTPAAVSRHGACHICFLGRQTFHLYEPSDKFLHRAGAFLHLQSTFL